METLEDIIKLLRIIIIPLGTTFRVVFCFVKMIYDEEKNNPDNKITGMIAQVIRIMKNSFRNFMCKILPLLYDTN